MGLWDYDESEEDEQVEEARSPAVLADTSNAVQAAQRKRAADELPEALQQDSDDEHGLRATLRGKRGRAAAAARGAKGAKAHAAGPPAALALQTVVVVDDDEGSNPGSTKAGAGAAAEQHAPDPGGPAGVGHGRMPSATELKSWLRTGSLGALRSVGSAGATGSGGPPSSNGNGAHAAAPPPPAAAQGLAPPPAAPGADDELSAETRAQLEKSRRLVADMDSLQREEDEEDEEGGRPGRATAGLLATTSSGALRPRPIEALMRLKQAAADAALQQEQLQEQRRQQQQEENCVVIDSDDEGVRGGGDAAAIAALAGVPDPDKREIELKHQHGSFRVRVRPGDPCSRLAAAFVHLAKQQQGDAKRVFPTDPAKLRLEFDGDKLLPGTTIEDAGMEDGDVVDVTWK